MTGDEHDATRGSAGSGSGSDPVTSGDSRVDANPERASELSLDDELARIEDLPLPERAAVYGELHERLGRALDGDN